MSETIIITWEVDDGYVGGARPHEVEIDVEDIKECESVEEVENLIEEMVEADFNDKVSWYIKDDCSSEIEKILSEKE